MAISFKTDSDHGFNTAKIFGVAQALIDSAKACGVSISLSGPGSYSVQGPTGSSTSTITTFALVPVKGAALSLAKQGTLGPASKSAICSQFTDGLNKAVASLGAVADSKASLAGSPKPLPAAAKALTVKGTATPAGAVALMDATAILQPVKGTSPGSTYYVVAMYPGLNLAARMKASEISIRAAGSALSGYKSKLKELKFEDGGQYCSVHFKLSEPQLAVKALGAIVATLGVNSALSMADFNQFVGV